MLQRRRLIIIHLFLVYKGLCMHGNEKFLSNKFETFLTSSQGLSQAPPSAP